MSCVFVASENRQNDDIVMAKPDICLSEHIYSLARINCLSVKSIWTKWKHLNLLCFSLVRHIDSSKYREEFLFSNLFTRDSVSGFNPCKSLMTGWQVQGMYSLVHLIFRPEASLDLHLWSTMSQSSKLLTDQGQGLCFKRNIKKWLKINPLIWLN